MLLIFGLGYSGRAIARAAIRLGIEVCATSRDPAALAPEPGVTIVAFDAAEFLLRTASHILATAAPGDAGDPVLARYAGQISESSELRWIGYLSTTGVYGNRDGGWVDEDTAPAPQSARTERRVRAEAAWAGYARKCAVDIFRLAGIYGPGRSMFGDLRAGNARNVVKPGHLFGRIHRDDIAAGVLAAIGQNPPAGVQKFNFSDDVPASGAEVVVAAAALLGIAPPAPLPFEDAAPKMSPMALSFWAENRRVASAKTKARLGIAWKYPSYREGLAAILAEEAAEATGEQ